MDERERLIRHALGRIAPDEAEWRHFSALLVPDGSCPDRVVRTFLARNPRPYAVPLEAISYSVHWVAGRRVVFVDMRSVDRLRDAVDQAFSKDDPGGLAHGHFRA